MNSKKNNAWLVEAVDTAYNRLGKLIDDGQLDGFTTPLCRAALDEVNLLGRRFEQLMDTILRDEYRRRDLIK